MLFEYSYILFKCCLTDTQKHFSQNSRLTTLISMSACCTPGRTKGPPYRLCYVVWMLVDVYMYTDACCLNVVWPSRSNLSGPSPRSKKWSGENKNECRRHEGECERGCPPFGSPPRKFWFIGASKRVLYVSLFSNFTSFCWTSEILELFSCRERINYLLY